MTDLLVTRHSLGDEPRQRVQIERSPLTRDHEGLGDLARLRILTSGDAAIGDVRMLQENGLEFRRRNAEAFIFDHLLLTLDEIEIAILVDPADVACIEPAISQSLGSLFRRV